MWVHAKEDSSWETLGCDRNGLALVLLDGKGKESQNRNEGVQT